MSDIHRSLLVQPVPMLGVGMRMMQLGFDELQAALGLQAKRVERDRAAVQHACDALLDARTYDMGTFVNTWQALTREYFAASAVLFEQSQDLAMRNQTALGALFRDAVLDFEKVCVRAQAQASPQAGAVPQAADWMTYLGRFAGVHPNGEAAPAKSASGPTSANA